MYLSHLLFYVSVAMSATIISAHPNPLPSLDLSQIPLHHRHTRFLTQPPLHRRKQHKAKPAPKAPPSKPDSPQKEKLSYQGITPDNYRWSVRLVGKDHSAHWHSCPNICKKAAAGKEEECTKNCQQCAENLESQGDCSMMGKTGRGDMGMASMLCQVVTDKMNKGSCGNKAYTDALKGW